MIVVTWARRLYSIMCSLQCALLIAKTWLFSNVYNLETNLGSVLRFTLSNHYTFVIYTVWTVFGNMHLFWWKISTYFIRNEVLRIWGYCILYFGIFNWSCQRCDNRSQVKHLLCFFSMCKLSYRKAYGQVLFRILLSHSLIHHVVKKSNCCNWS